MKLKPFDYFTFPLRLEILTIIIVFLGSFLFAIPGNSKSLRNKSLKKKKIYKKYSRRKSFLPKKINTIKVNPMGIIVSDGISWLSYQKGIYRYFSASIKLNHFQYSFNNQSQNEKGSGTGYMIGLEYFPFYKFKYLSGAYAEISAGEMEFTWNRKSEDNNIGLAEGNYYSVSNKGKYFSYSLGVGFRQKINRRWILEPRIDHYTYSPQKSDSTKKVLRWEPGIGLGVQF